MPLRAEPYSFPLSYARRSTACPACWPTRFPDRYGNALINAWLAAQGRTPESFDAVERLCYIGRRGEGALEFEPALGPARPRRDSQVDALVELGRRGPRRSATRFATSLSARNEEAAMQAILRVGTSAGGARAKAIIAWNPATDEVRSGQVDAGPGFEHWLLKFDGVKANRDKEPRGSRGYGAIEYAYALMAARGRHRDDRLPAARGERAPPLHDAPLRPARRRRQAAHADRSARSRHFDYNEPAPTATSRRC